MKSIVTNSFGKYKVGNILDFTEGLTKQLEKRGFVKTNYEEEVQELKGKEAKKIKNKNEKSNINI